MRSRNDHLLRHRAAEAVQHLGHGIDRVLADRQPGPTCSIAPRKPDGRRPVIFNFNANGGGH